MMLAPRGKGLLATMIRYKNEVQRASGPISATSPTSRSPPTCSNWRPISSRPRPAISIPSRFEDRYEQALSELIAAKRSGKSPPSAPSPQPSNVINLMDALRRSVRAERGGKSAARPARGRRKAEKSPRRPRRQAGGQAAAEEGGLIRGALRPIARNASSTSPPNRAAVSAAATGRSFVVQKHDATRLHYDFRLEHRRRAQELGGDQGAEPGARRKAPRRPCRGPSARLWRVRGHDPERPVWRRHGDAVGPRHVGARGRSRQGFQEGPSRLRSRRREAQRPLASGAHARPQRREARELAADQRRRRSKRARRPIPTFSNRRRNRSPPSAPWTRSPPAGNRRSRPR